MRSDELGVTVDGVRARASVLETGLAEPPEVPSDEPVAPAPAHGHPMLRITAPADLPGDAWAGRPEPPAAADPSQPTGIDEVVRRQVVSGGKLSAVLAREVVEVAKQLSEARLLVEVLGMRLDNAAARYDQAVAAEARQPARRSVVDADDDRTHGIPEDLVQHIRAHAVHDTGPTRPGGRPRLPLFDRVLAVVVSAGLELSARETLPFLARHGVVMHHNTLIRARRDPEVTGALESMIRPLCEAGVHVSSDDTERMALALWDRFVASHDSFS